MKKYDEVPIQTMKCCSCVGFDVKCFMLLQCSSQGSPVFVCFVFLEIWPVVLKSTFESSETIYSYKHSILE